MAQFYYRDEKVIIPQHEESQTLLHWLRANDYKGTKEGCASGDCGACTVVIAALNGEQLSYRSINSCITLLAQCDGYYIISVEDLEQNGELHPVQQAMVNTDGSQCGFCTPGFIMSLFALYHQKEPIPLNREAINSALGGNLCRCTGYTSIIEAALASCHHPQPDYFSDKEKDIIAKLKSIEVTTKLKDALKTLQNPTIRPVTGGTDLGLEVSQNYQKIDVCALNNIRELRAIEKDDFTFSIGAAAPYEEVQKAIKDDYPQFAELIERIGSCQIRNQGSLGGNIANASPIGDTPPVLLALAAELEIMSTKGNRHVNIDTFFTGYRQTILQQGEIIARIHIPRAKKNSQLIVKKLSKRHEDDISTVLMALYYEVKDDCIDNIRLAYGGMAATPIRATNTERFLQGFLQGHASLTDDNINDILDTLDLEPISDVRASKAYRLSMAKQLLADALRCDESSIHDLDSIGLSS